MKKLTLNRKEILEEDITGLAKYQESWCKPNFMSWDKEAGQTEYKLYSYLSYLIDSPIVLDIGTLFGGSALALSTNLGSDIISYDLMSIETHEPDALKKSNIELRVANFMEDDIEYGLVNLIVIDVDPHDGLQEPPMVEFIVNQGFEGLILLDDIHLSPEMEQMWNNFEYEKHDATQIGHFSGTGILNIGQKFELDFILGE
jgi:predicted O-methyltransferase YrrM